jgi:cation diffusion facilitator CzcD-associated flavoprotein CzcO
MKEVSAPLEKKPTHHDVVVIGAGFVGLYAIYRFLRLNLDVQCFEAGDGVGGTWYWNRYPGARVDIESMEYSYSFDADLQMQWKWPEYFSPQADLEKYANHVADRFKLRDKIEFNARVNRLRFDEDTNLWHVYTSRGHHVTARYIIAATGALDATNVPPFRGLDSFQGRWCHTSKWPKEGVDFSGKRVGLIGTGSTGIQTSTAIAAKVDHLYVFQRTPAYSMPSMNRPLDPEYESEWKQNYSERRALALANSAATYFVRNEHGSAFDYSPEERKRIYEEAWRARNGLMFSGTFNDIMTSLEANETASEFIRSKIRQIVKNPETAEMLCPKTYPLGTKRMCMDTGYFEIFNRDNVTLVDVRSNPIVEFIPTGLRTTAAEYHFDIGILATGFDAVTGSFTRLNVTGRGGLNLRDKWVERPTNFLGVLVAGFPNLFMVHGPGSPGVLAQMITGGQWQVDWLAQFIENMEEKGHRTVETTPDWEERWAAEMDAAADHTLYKYAESWYVGANIPGKPRVFMIYIGGFPRYMQRCKEQIEAGYEGFVFDR